MLHAGWAFPVQGMQVGLGTGVQTLAVSLLGTQMMLRLNLVVCFRVEASSTDERVMSVGS
jgi:hypothetical protein